MINKYILLVLLTAGYLLNAQSTNNNGPVKYYGSFEGGSSTDNSGTVKSKIKPVKASDVDINIPEGVPAKSNRYALIIGNEDYSSNQPGLQSEANVDYAAHDAAIFKEYAQKVLGVPAENIFYKLNATSITMNREIDKLDLVAQATRGDVEIIFYYAGHGYPSENKEAYVVPVDVSGADLQYAIKLKDIYSRLTAHSSKRVTIFLDACFSGGSRNQPLVASRAIKIRPKEEVVNGNMVVFSAVNADQTSMPYKEKSHGIFTYFLLKKLQETSGNVSYGDLSDYLQKQVAIKSAVVNSKEQSPTVITSPDLGEGWRNWKMK